MSKQNLLHRFFIQQYVGYYSDQMYRIVFPSDGKIQFIKADASFRPKLLILSRNHYQESIKQYPITDKTELKKVLTLNSNSDFDTTEQVHWKILGSDNSSHAVNFWIPDTTILNQYTPIFWFPESLLVAANASQESIFEILTEVNWYLYSKGKEGGCISLINGPVINNVDLFQSSVGISHDKPISIINKGELAQSLVDGLIKQSTLDIITFFIQKPDTDQPFNVWPRLKWSFLGIVAYFLISSAYLLLHLNGLEQQNLKSKVNVQQAMQVRSEVDHLIEQLEVEKGTLENRQFTIYVWEILSPLLETDMLLTQIYYSDGRYRITGTASKAIELLKLLAQNRLVVEAKFDAPVAKTRKRERFMISFKLNPLQHHKTDLQLDEIATQ